MNTSTGLLGTLYAFIAIAILIAITACGPVLYVESPAPPGRAARMDAVTGFWGLKYYRMEISTGVALALTCDHGGPCEHVKVTSSDPAIVEVRSASLSVLKTLPYPMYGGPHTEQQTAAAIVVVGKAPGHTHVHVETDDGDRDIEVVVIPPPSAPGSSDRPAQLPPTNDSAQQIAITRI